jgi:hypothetical protein
LRNEWVNTQKVESIVQVTPSTMYSLLMNSSKAFNKSCLSLYLSMLPKLALKVTDLVHGSFLAILTARHYLYVIQALWKR